jgi:microsomal dipeptidase-like Zn-dependent dipeptidase
VSGEESSAAQLPPLPVGGDYWQGTFGSGLWGFADLHAHLMSHAAFGGRMFWGRPYDPDHLGPAGLEHALGSCAPAHSGLINVNPESGHPVGGGWPDFDVWPRFTTTAHQQAYIDWIYRAYQGGLRLVICSTGHNETLASAGGGSGPRDDRGAIVAQVEAVKEMISVMERQAGGPGKAWLQIAYSPVEARAIIAAGRLAVVLGVEVDSLGNWRRFEDLHEQCGRDLLEARRLISAELDWLHDLGIRQITPVHLTDNAFGGTAIYRRLFDASNMVLTGRHYKVVDGWHTGVRFRLERDTKDSLARLVALQGRRLSPERFRETGLLRRLPVIKGLLQALDASPVSGGHINAFGLTKYGLILLEEMMERGMVIDLEHMSQRATDVALALAESRDYPVICSHVWFRDLFFTADVPYAREHRAEYGTADVWKVAHEGAKRGDQIELIGRLGGMVAPMLNQGDLAGPARVMPELTGRLPPRCAGSSTAWAEAYLYALAKMGGRGVAIGSDVNGMAGLPGPRFGTQAAYYVHGDALRESQRRVEIDRQANGVRYTTPLRDYRWFRFEDSGPGAYDEEERCVWQAIAQFKAGFNPSTQAHQAGDVPAGAGAQQERVDCFTKGLWAAAEEQGSRRDRQPDGWSAEQWAAYLAYLDQTSVPVEQPRTRELIEKVRGIWKRWQAMDGLNTPMSRCTAGPRHDYDFDLDGMAHYGLLPDFLQDLKNLGLTSEELSPLFHSAEDYVHLWERCLGGAR